MKTGKISRVVSLVLFVSWCGLLLATYLSRQHVVDWWKLRGYTPSSETMALVAKTTMTDRARHLLYVNRPALVSGAAFRHECPMGGEKTIILGCYKGGDRGIYLYRVSDPRLDGVVEVTAAHEMLHAAYERLSSDERRSLDRQLEAFYRQSLRDERVKTTVDSYKTLEPSELPNEMHSIFATEVAVLPTELEQYYTRYFRDRQRVVALATAYQSEFTLRREQVALYDAELAAVKTTIDSNQAGLTTQRRTLETRQAELTRLRASGDIAGYNARVAGYNQLVDTYNETIQSTRGLITHYNDTVEKRNAIALEERQLTQALSADSLPTQQ